jgi:hypothetical protein
MSRLADYILRGQIADARELAESDPNSLGAVSTGPEQLYPGDIALRCGQIGLLVCLIRLGAPMKLDAPDPEALLRDYLGHLSDSYFCASRMDGLAASVWEQTFETRDVFFDGQDPSFGLSASEKADVRWLVERCRIPSREAFLAYDR